jgi:hypothetical protein
MIWYDILSKNKWYFQCLSRITSKVIIIDLLSLSKDEDKRILWDDTGRARGAGGGRDFLPTCLEGSTFCFVVVVVVDVVVVVVVVQRAIKHCISQCNFIDFSSSAPVQTQAINFCGLFLLCFESVHFLTPAPHCPNWLHLVPKSPTEPHLAKDPHPQWPHLAPPIPL